MTKEFKLSEKMFKTYSTGIEVISKEDVKEFIIRRNRLDLWLLNKKITWEKYLIERDKLAGDLE